MRNSIEKITAMLKCSDHLWVNNYNSDEKGWKGNSIVQMARRWLNNHPNIKQKYRDML